MFSLITILKNTKIVLIVAILLGFFLPHLAHKLEPYIIPIMILMMTIAIKDIGFGYFNHSYIKDVKKLTMLSYLLLTPLMLFCSWLFVPEGIYRNAMYVYALMPPAINVVSLSYIFKGDVSLSFFAEVVSYFFGLLIIPLGMLALFGKAINPVEIFYIAALIILLPYILSRSLHNIESRTFKIPRPVTKSFLNVCNGITIYIIIGVNRYAIFEHVELLFPVVFLLLICKFLLGSLTYVHLRHKIKKQIDIVYILFASFKNGGAATAFTILVFGIEASAPFAIVSIMATLYIVYLEWFIVHKFD